MSRLKDVLKIFVEFTEKHPQQKVILIFFFFQNLIKVTLYRGQFALIFFRISLKRLFFRTPLRGYLCKTSSYFLHNGSWLLAVNNCCHDEHHLIQVCYITHHCTLISFKIPTKVLQILHNL